MNKIKVLIADDQKIFCEAVSFLLQSSNKIEVIGSAYNGVELIDKTSILLPDVILMDVNMPEMNGVEATKLVLQKHPNIKIIALTMHKNAEVFRQMMDAGALGFLLKETDFAELSQAITVVFEGKSFVSNKLDEFKQSL